MAADPVDPNAVRERWSRIRKNPKCELALNPESVAEYLRKPEHELVQERIEESLSQFARYRVATGAFQSAGMSKGDLATCEGLEAFLVPAVEGSLAFVKVIDGLGELKRDFIDGITSDIGTLIDQWEKGRFSGQPYSDDMQIKGALSGIISDRIKDINITEAAAMACRVLIHILTLKLNPGTEEKGQNAFRKEVGGNFDDKKIFVALRNAVNFLVCSFQKGEGETDDQQIANAQIAGEPGSGWSWTWLKGTRFSPMLFFTAAAVDAFAELDLYLIRPSTDTDRPLERGTDDQRKLLEFYNENKLELERFQLCVEMARRWVQRAVLPELSKGFGEYKEPEVDLVRDPQLEEYEDALKGEKLAHPPMVLYNTLYGLQILLWSWADWDENGSAPDQNAKNKTNRALAQLVDNYNSIPVVRRVLTNCPYKFYLPGKGFFRQGAEKKCTYLDFGFLPLFTRLLVLFVVYGVGDRNLLEPVIRDLYVQLIQNRNGDLSEYTALWSEKAIEVFSTQRAIHALTYYFAYARGKQLVGGSGVPAGDVVVLRNLTGRPLILQALQAVSEEMKLPPAAKPPEPPPPDSAFTAKTFGDYCRERNFQMDTSLRSDEEVTLMKRAAHEGNRIIKDIRSGAMPNVASTRLFLNALIRVAETPKVGDRLREPELDFLMQQYDELLSGGAKEAG